MSLEILKMDGDKSNKAEESDKADKNEVTVLQIHKIELNHNHCKSVNKSKKHKKQL